jgi:hypothetical protein
VSAQRPDIPAVATPATAVAKPTGWHQEANPPNVASLTTRGGSSRSGPSRGQPTRRGRLLGRGDVTAPEKKTVRLWHAPQPRLFLGLVSGQASQSSSATNRKKVVLHSARRNAVTVCRKRVIKLRRTSSALTFCTTPTTPEPRKLGPESSRFSRGNAISPIQTKSQPPRSRTPEQPSLT